LNLGKLFFVTTVCCGSTKLQSMLNRRCNGLWWEFPPSHNSRCHLLSPRGV
jgi:hypothetical protein